MSIIGKEFDFVDMSGVFVKSPLEGFLLQDLGLFHTKTNNNIFISVDTMDDSQRELTKAVARFGSDMSAINTPKAKNYSLPSILRVYSSTVTSQDVQGRRQPGTDLQQTIQNVVADKALRHHTQARRDREAILADALFRNVVQREGGVTLDYQDYWDQEDSGAILQQTATIAAGVSDDAIMSINQTKQQLRLKCGGWASNIAGFYLFCGADAFWTLLSNPSIQQQQLYNNIGSDVLFPPALHGAFEHFKLGNLTVICVTDPLYQIDTTDAYLVPKFTNVLADEVAPVMLFNCPCSRHLEFAVNSPVLAEYHYTLRDKFTNVEIFAEASQMPVIMRPDMAAMRCTITGD
ncbi:major capsid protein [Citrobacter amalonaticus]|uniref:major capsid protein n=1 Tax=Citrobacter amalonaticus TaxID=35703 RepID=UPI0025A709A1|nr:major capsid protein [Citrobacter amalonaticus]EKY5001815.1 major capsid protein [Citrobacter amalonaticus]